MSAVSSAGTAAGFLLVIGGIWLLLQTIVGGLPARIASLGGSSASSTSPASSAAGDVAKGAAAVGGAASKAGSTVLKGLGGTKGLLEHLGSFLP